MDVPQSVYGLTNPLMCAMSPIFAFVINQIAKTGQFGQERLSLGHANLQTRAVDVKEWCPVRAASAVKPQFGPIDARPLL
ncbi:hypothetical protein URH17368_0245 [Alicyclobacillus hesperidum URH17-3-68]|nr:hypothetical protein URH17368_0245 [Alicyclobacillus hesperidum URH17-3-68]